ncbi:hypothetical protein TNCV_3642861 [Trichonephila clavipes]|nr:hypothetical protein TNCV_3642861 [Trichonephila clavipes]
MTDSHSQTSFAIPRKTNRSAQDFFLKRSFKIPIKRSQKPPHHGEEGGLNFQRISWTLNSLSIVVQSNCLKALFRPVKLVPLSEYITEIRSLLAINLRIAWMKSVVLSEVISSRWTALNTAQVKRTIHAFCLDLVNKGPAKSTPET